MAWYVAFVGVLTTAPTTVLAAPHVSAEVAPAQSTAELVVDTAEDVVDKDGDCSLREAIRAANHARTVDGCVGGPGADVISFADGISLIALNGTLPAVTSDVTIVGGGDVTIDGSGASAAGLRFTNGTSTIAGLTVTANDGHGVLVAPESTATLTVVDSALTGNSGSGLAVVASNRATATVSVSDSTVAGNAANGIVGTARDRATTSLMIAASTISDNTRNGIVGRSRDRAATNIAVSDSTVAGNATNGIVGNALDRATTDVTIENSTTSGNAGRGIVGHARDRATATLAVRNSTIADNAGGVSLRVLDRGTLAAAITNSIVAGASSASVVNCIVSGDVSVSGSGNLSNDDSCAAMGFSQATDAELDLGPLQVNGSGTPSFLPGPASVAIDNGDDTTCLPVDQRGQPRPVDGDSDGTATCDIGSVEVEEVAVDLLVDTAEDVVDGDGDCSLREAIQAANEATMVDGCLGTAGPDTITFADGITTVSLRGDLPDITTDITIDGGGDVTLDGNYVTFSGLTFRAGTNTISGLTITHSGSMGVWVQPTTTVTLTVRDSTLTENQDEVLYINPRGGTTATVIVENTTFTGFSEGLIVMRDPGGTTNLTVRNSTLVTGVFSEWGIWLIADRSEGLTATFTNTIITGRSFEADCLIEGDVSVSGSGNLSNDDSCAAMGFSQASDAELNLGPLQVNGSGTPSFLPGPASVAIDNGDDTTCLPVDQRGQPRPVDGDSDGTATCDIGSVEAQPA